MILSKDQRTKDGPQAFPVTASRRHRQKFPLSGGRVLSVASILRCLVLGALFSQAAFAANTLDHVLSELKDLHGSARAAAIQEAAKHVKIHSPLSSADGEVILARNHRGARAHGITFLAPLFESDLSAQYAAEILGPETALAGKDRVEAIAALNDQERIGPGLGIEAAMLVRGTTHGERALAIEEIAPNLHEELSAEAISAILGALGVLQNDNRVHAISAIARRLKRPANFSSEAGAVILDGAVHGSRVKAIRELARLFKNDLNGFRECRILS